jgi:hypothetical protein
MFQVRLLREVLEGQLRLVSEMPIQSPKEPTLGMATEGLEQVCGLTN